MVVTKLLDFDILVSSRNGGEEESDSSIKYMVILCFICKERRVEERKEEMKEDAVEKAKMENNGQRKEKEKGGGWEKGMRLRDRQ